MPSNSQQRKQAAEATLLTNMSEWTREPQLSLLPDNNESRLIVADVDVGIDDAWALFMLLKAETAAHPVDHRLLAVTCVGGNTNVDQVAHNVARVMHCARRSDVIIDGYICPATSTPVIYY